MTPAIREIDDDDAARGSDAGGFSDRISDSFAAWGYPRIRRIGSLRKTSADQLELRLAKIRNIYWTNELIAFFTACQQFSLRRWI